MKNTNKGYIDSFDLVLVGMITAAALLVMVIIVAVAGFPGGIGQDYSKGSRIGTITKLSHKGIIYKSYEGELVMGGTRRSTNSDGVVSNVANVQTFSTTDESIAKTLIAAMETGQVVEIKYNGWWIHPIGIDSDMEATSVKIIK